MIFVIGSSGRLGSALTSFFGEEALGIDRSVYEDWWKTSEKKKIEKYFLKLEDSSNSILIAAGLLDPSFTEEEMLRVNYLMPKNIIEVARSLNIPVGTFGTISEAFQGVLNPYLRSKNALGEYISTSRQEEDLVTHIRLHTLYGGGDPKPYMFLGQIMESLILRQPLHMTGGRQLREYHYISDDVVAINQILKSKFRGVIDLNHGQPITLRRLAENLFSRFESDHLLCLGLLPEPTSENYTEIYLPQAPYRDVVFQTSLNAIGDYLELSMKKG